MATTVLTDRTTVREGTMTTSRNWIDSLVSTTSTTAFTVLRIGLGLIMLPHGLQKSLGLFGGSGFSGTMQFFTGQGIPAAIAFLVIVSENLGSIGLLTGFLTRVAAFGTFCVMFGAVLLVHVPNGFFMNWSGVQRGEGFEYHILAMTMAITLMIGGAGRYSFDRLIQKKRIEDRAAGV